MGHIAKEFARKAIVALHKVGLRLGVVIIRNHYYTAVPDLNVLARTKQTWARRSELVGVEVDLDRQVKRLREVCLPFSSEFRGNGAYTDACRSACGPGFGYIEAQALHAVVRHLKPHNIIEVGCGVSTFCMLKAAALNASEGVPGRLVCIEPHPTDWLRNAPVELIAKAVQSVSLETFTKLGAGDLLFIDSSHAVRTGSDVNFLILEVLPRLRAGVVVHFHDITLPFGYSPVTLQVLVQPAETALLHAFLIGNQGVEIVFCLSQLHYERPEVLSEVFPEYVPRSQPDGLRDPGLPFYQPPGHFPTSAYLRVCDRLA